MLKYNSGLDILFCCNKKLRQLAKVRMYRSLFGGKISVEKLSKDDLHKLRILSNKTKLINLFPSTQSPQFIDFANETRFLKHYLSRLSDMQNLSVSQKIQIYTSSREYTLNPASTSFPETVQNWISHSWTIISQSFLAGTSQQKIANRLGLKREFVNRKLKHDSYELRVINNFVPVSSSILRTGKILKKEQIIHRLKQLGLNGKYKVDHRGVLHRQIPNTYELTNKYKKCLKFAERGTFYYSNKHLNQKILRNLKTTSFNKSEIERSFKSLNLEQSLPATKVIALKNKLGKIHPSKLFGNNGELKLPTVKRLLDNVYVEYENTGKKGLKSLYPKLQNEIIHLNKVGFEYSNNFDREGTQKNHLPIRMGLSFKSITKRSFDKKLKYLENFQRDPKYLEKYNLYRMEQRLFYLFKGFQKKEAA